MIQMARLRNLTDVGLMLHDGYGKPMCEIEVGGYVDVNLAWAQRDPMIQSMVRAGMLRIELTTRRTALDDLDDSVYPPECDAPTRRTG